MPQSGHPRRAFGVSGCPLIAFSSFFGPRTKSQAGQREYNHICHNHPPLPSRPAVISFTCRALARLPRRASAPSEAASFSTDRAGGRSQNPWKNFHPRAPRLMRDFDIVPPQAFATWPGDEGVHPAIRHSLAFMSFPHHRNRNKRRKITMYYLAPCVLCCSTQLQPSAIHYNNVIILCLDQQDSVFIIQTDSSSTRIRSA